MKDDNGGWIRVSEFERRLGRKWKALVGTVIIMAGLLVFLVIKTYVIGA